MELSYKIAVGDINVARYDFTHSSVGAGGLYQVVYYVADISNPTDVAMLIVGRGIRDKELPLEVLDVIAKTVDFDVTR